MNLKQIIDLCIRLFPELLLLYDRMHMEKEPELVKRLTAVHVVAKGMKKGEDYAAFQKVLADNHLPFVEGIKVARAGAELAAVRESIRSKRVLQARRGHTEQNQLTDAELAQEAVDQAVA